jgi:hypothetical protein
MVVWFFFLMWFFVLFCLFFAHRLTLFRASLCSLEAAKILVTKQRFGEAYELARRAQDAGSVDAKSVAASIESTMGCVVS